MRTETRHRALQILSLTLALTLAGCGEDGTGPADSDGALVDRDVAVVAADATLEDVQMMLGPAGPAPGFPELFSPGFDRGPDCSQDGARVRCGPFRHDGHTYSREVTFFDAAGNTQEAYDPETTASVQVDVLVSGEANRQSWSASVSREKHMTVSGLEGDETRRTFNGIGSQDISRSRHGSDGAVRSYDMEGTSVTQDVVVPHPPAPGAWPLSGTITRTIEVTLTRDDETVTRDRAVTITFDGSQFATVTVNGKTFTLDLSQRDPARGMRRRGR